MSSDPEYGDTKRPISDENGDIMRQEVVHNQDILGNTNVTKEDAMHMGELTQEELVIEKKLRRRIDMLIMPLVMLVGCSCHPFNSFGC